MAQRARFFTFFWLALTILALSALGALKMRQDFLTRGLPQGLPEPIFAGGARLGINVSLTAHDMAALDEQLAQIHATGIRYLKQPFYFSDPFDWSESDAIIEAVGRHDLILAPLLDGDPASHFAPPADPTVFADWAGEFASRYGDQLRYYIVWDEPNLASHWGNQPANPSEYAALLTAAAQAIRRADADAVIIAAPLAPTIETGPDNLADPLFLQLLYEAGAADAFDVVAGKPYGFDTGPDDRVVDHNRLNFSRAVLLREMMAGYGDEHKALWAGNWGWNSLPDGWTGPPSIWGQTDEAQRAAWTIAALNRARQEWPWIGVMFLENWQPDAPADNPLWGFSIAGRETAAAVQTYQHQIDDRVAYPGFYLAQAGDPAQVYRGGWRFSPEFGADISQTGDNVTFTFWGTVVGLRVRRADFRARLYVTVDGRPANALPQDEHGSALVLTAADPHEDILSTELVARNLPPGQHTLHVAADRGWDQWALNGFSVGYRPPEAVYHWSLVGLAFASILTLLLSIRSAWQADWGALGARIGNSYGRLSEQAQLALTAAVAALIALSGWLTWGAQAAGLYRRLGDSTQLALTATAASLFYVTPAFFLYIVALGLLFLLIYLRPAWGVALIAFCFPFYVQPVLKPVFHYRFSPVEVFTLVTAAAFVLSRLTHLSAGRKGNVARAKWKVESIRGAGNRVTGSSFHPADYAVAVFVFVATLSLFFTERLDVATNEWRMVILEPALFYLLLRSVRLKERELWVVLDAFVLGGLVVALYGLWQYVAQPEQLITAEAGLMRLRSIYGSPNNVALYLGRILPLLVAMLLLGSGDNGRRRWLYTAALLPIILAFLLTFSRGGLLLSLPAALLFIFWRWQRQAGRRTWPWAAGFALLGIAGFILAQQIPQLAGRLDPGGATGVFRVNLWRASLNMFVEQPLFGVGLDNFLYLYRSRYIFDAAWQEPNLNHPHNIVLDFATRLGLLGLLSGGWLLWQLARTLGQVQGSPPLWRPVVVGLGGAFVAMAAHGLVDHSFFLVDLAFAFYLMLGTAVWLYGERIQVERESE